MAQEGFLNKFKREKWKFWRGHRDSTC